MDATILDDAFALIGSFFLIAAVFLRRVEVYLFALRTPNFPGTFFEHEQKRTDTGFTRR
jgi:hypothetical protein